MKEFMKFNKLRKLSNIQNINFGKGIVVFMLIIFINDHFFPNKDNFLYFFIQISIYISAMVFIFNSELENNITLVKTYPISYKIKKTYNILYTILLSMLTFLAMVTFFSIIALIIYIIKGSVTEEVTGNDSYSLYHLGFNLSLLFFYYFLSSIKDTKLWWIILVLGNVGYIIINLISKYVLYGHMLIKKSINLEDYTNKLNVIYYFCIFSLFIISAIIYILVNLRNTKIKKGIN